MPPRQIGPYILIGEIDRGAMGVVYRARHPSLRRELALKVLMPQFESDATCVQRFRQEAETAACLKHENIVTVYEASVDRPPYYIAMELLRGRSLANLLSQRKRLGVAEAVHIVQQICSALTCAHQHGIIHRDIKPGNIMVAENGRTTLTDFGIAKAANQTRITRVGMVFGSPDYMSPEQAKGLALDHRSDIYSIGAILYEMLTGRAPFDTGDPMTTMYRIIHEEPAPASSLNPEIPAAIEAVLRRAMKKRPAERFQSCQELEAALESALGKKPHAPPVSRSTATPAVRQVVQPLQPTSRNLALHKTLMLMLLALVVLLFIGLLYTALSSGGSSPGGLGGQLPVIANQEAAVAAPPARRRASVPEVRGLKLELAQATLSFSGTKCRVMGEEFDAVAPKGCILRQSPEAGSSFTPFTTVQVILSRGPGVIVPQLVGASEHRARELLRRAALKASSSKRFDDTVPAGSVLSCEPRPGAHVAPGSSIKLIISSGKKSYSCGRCGASFPRASALRRHLAEAHRTQKRLACPRCGAVCATATELARHERIRHTAPQPTQIWTPPAPTRPAPAPTNQLPSPQPFVCPTCGSRLASEADLAQHREIFHLLRYRCSVCGVSFMTQDALTSHNRQAHPYACPTCNQSFQSLAALTQHREKAHSLRQHRCTFCGENFETQTQLHNHIALYHIQTGPTPGATGSAQPGR